MQKIDTRSSTIGQCLDLADWHEARAAMARSERDGAREQRHLELAEAFMMAAAAKRKESRK